MCQGIGGTVMNYTKSVEKWGVFEFYSEGTTAGNPFLERGITALFESDSERKTVNGFYDGINGIGADTDFLNDLRHILHLCVAFQKPFPDFP